VSENRGNYERHCTERARIANTFATSHGQNCWSVSVARKNRNDDQHDAYSAAEWMRRADRDGTLMEFFASALSPQEREVAHIEGWILGIK
jgi:hypothetical protein